MQQHGEHTPRGEMQKMGYVMCEVSTDRELNHFFYIYTYYYGISVRRCASG